MWRVYLCITLVLSASVCAAADVGDVQAVPFLNDKGRADYAKFLTLKPARAFAIAENGVEAYAGQRDSRPQAIAGALYHCNKFARNVCRVYAVNDDVVYLRYPAFEQRSRALRDGLHQARFSAAAYGDELHDFRVPSPEALHKEDQGYDADTPLALHGVHTIQTVDLVKMMTAPDPPILIDVLRGEGHQTIPGAYWLRGAGDAGRSEDVNAEVRDRLGFVLNGLTKDNKAVPLVFFCLGVRCWLSYNAALRARDLGYTNVYWYRGGLKAWAAAHLDVLDAVQYGQVW